MFKINFDGSLFLLNYLQRVGRRLGHWQRASGGGEGGCRGHHIARIRSRSPAAFVFWTAAAADERSFTTTTRERETDGIIDVCDTMPKFFILPSMCIENEYFGQSVRFVYVAIDYSSSSSHLLL